MGSSLSRAEIEAILSGLDLSLSENALPTPAPPFPPLEVDDFDQGSSFRRGPSDAIRLELMAASRTVQTAMMRMLKTPVVVTFVTAERTTGKNVIATPDALTCLALFCSTSTPEVWLVEIRHSLAIVMLDCLLGGQPSATEPPLLRSFTELETSLVGKALSMFLLGLHGQPLQTDSLQLVKLISDRTSPEELSLHDEFVRIEFDAVCGPCQGQVQLCVPLKAIPPTSILSQIPPDESPRRKQRANPKRPVVVTACVARLNLRTRDLAELNPGDILLTETESTAEMSLEVDQQVIFRGTAAQSHGHKVFLITTPVSTAAEGEIFQADLKRPKIE